LKRPNLHVLLYGDTGSGKSTFASTFSKPLLVWCFDHNGKEIPYIKGGEDQGLKEYGIETSRGEIFIPYRDVVHPDGLIRIEYFNKTDDIENPTAFSYFRTRMSILHNEYKTWKTVVIDSVTFMELQARKLEEKVLNPLPAGTSSLYEKGAKFDSRTWFAGATSSLEELLCIRLAGLDMNVVVICHIDRDKTMMSGEIMQVPFAPGRLSSRSLLSAAFSEQYRLYTQRDETGNRVYIAQTSSRDGYSASTQIDAPDPTWPNYEDLWVTWDRVYGDK